MEELSEGTKYYFHRKYNEAQEKLKLKFASVAALGQSSDFIKSVIDETGISFKEDREIIENLKNLMDMIKNVGRNVDIFIPYKLRSLASEGLL